MASHETILPPVKGYKAHTVGVRSGEVVLPDPSTLYRGTGSPVYATWDSPRFYWGMPQRGYFDISAALTYGRVDVDEGLVERATQRAGELFQNPHINFCAGGNPPVLLDGATGEGLGRLVKPGGAWSESATISGFLRNVHVLLAHDPRPVAPDENKGKPAPGMLSYAFSLQHGLSGRRTLIRVRAYLARYWSDVFSADEREVLALAWEAKHTPREVHLLTCPDQIEEAYTQRSFGSCMGYHARHYDSAEHPARVYGNSDLAVAVIYEPDAEPGDFSRIAARCVVWPAKGAVAPSIYGDYNRMRVSLATLGYDNDNNDFGGAKLARLENRDGTVIMPYLDIADSAEDCGGHVLIGKGGSLDVHRTDGLTEDPADMAQCECCGDSTYEEDLSSVVISFTRRWGSEEAGWCDSCVGARSFTCEHTEEQCSEDLLHYDTGPNGETYSTYGYVLGVEDGLLYTCAADGTVYCTTDDPSVEAEDTGETYHAEHPCLQHDAVHDTYVTDDADMVTLSGGSLTWADDARRGTEAYFERLAAMGEEDPAYPLHHAMTRQPEAA